MSKRQPVRGQAVKWCVCGDWFASERDEREHVGRCPGSPYVTCGCDLTHGCAAIRGNFPLDGYRCKLTKAQNEAR